METISPKNKIKKPVPSRKAKPVADDDEIYISLEDILQSLKDVKEGRVVKESLEEHFKRFDI
jgi:hypothetical protein